MLDEAIMVADVCDATQRYLDLTLYCSNINRVNVISIHTVFTRFYTNNNLRRNGSAKAKSHYWVLSG